jgi:hypothetical protein
VQSLLALALACLASPALADSGTLVGSAPQARTTTERLVPAKRVAIAFLPGLPAKTKPPLISRIAENRELAIGFASSVQGAYAPEQTLLDISGGSRVWTSLYDGELPVLTVLLPDGRGGVISGWSQITRRAKTPPADIVPGTLADAVGRIGNVGYVGPEGARNREAIVAADEDGHVERVALRPHGDIGREAVRRWRDTTLLVVKLPKGEDGSHALADLLAARRPADLLLVIESPARERRRLLAIGAAGLGNARNLTSDSTRTDGLVSSTDIASTVMDHLGIDPPHEVSGEVMSTSGGRSPAELTELKDRLSDIGPRRWIVVVAGLAAAALLAAGLAFIAPGGGVRQLGRASFLAALWLPAVLLVTGALAPSRLGEALMIAFACAVLALLTDRLIPWPRGIALPAAVTVFAHVIDLAFGSELIQRSLLGPNPILGARFFGVGNELEVTLGVIGLLGLGGLLASAPRSRQVWGFIVGGSLLMLLLSWGKLGADVGASIMLAAGTAAAVVAALGERPGKLRLAAILAAPLVALGVLAVLDIATGGNSHFTRSVLDAGGLGELADIAQRRVELSYRSLTRGIIGLLVVLAVVALIWGIRSRRRLLAPLRESPGARAGLIGAFVAVVVGALSNDSGPMILLIGTCYLALSAGYFLATAK